MTVKQFSHSMAIAFAAILMAGSLYVAKAQTSPQAIQAEHPQAGAMAETSGSPTSATKALAFNLNPSKTPKRVKYFSALRTEQPGLACTDPANEGNNTCYGTNAGTSISAGAIYNAFFGYGAGQSTTTGTHNAFFGYDAGQSTTSGGHNAFFGTAAGARNTTGTSNAFFGAFSGSGNTTGSANSYFGDGAGGNLNQTGSANAFFGSNAGYVNQAGWNSFFGSNAGRNNTLGANNAFFGRDSGYRNTTGQDNVFLGSAAGQYNVSGNRNVFIGSEAGLTNGGDSDNIFLGYQSDGAAGIINATALGARAKVTQSNSVVLGNNANVGIGTTAPKAKLQVELGDVYIKSQNRGMILRATDGEKCFRITVNNAGSLKATALPACP